MIELEANQKFDYRNRPTTIVAGPQLTSILKMMYLNSFLPSDSFMNVDWTSGLTSTPEVDCWED